MVDWHREYGDKLKSVNTIKLKVYVSDDLQIILRMSCVSINKYSNFAIVIYRCVWDIRMIFQSF